MRVFAATVGIVLLFVVSGSVFAGTWTVVNLHPTGAMYSWGLGVSGGQQVGLVGFNSMGTQEHASLWSGTAASWVDLGYHEVSGVSGGQQVGVAVGHASLWSGTAGSRVDLHPVGATSSYAQGVSSGYQVGYACFGGAPHASLWNGTAASWIDLNPSGSSYSTANGVSNGKQTGFAIFADGHSHAGLWSGTAASWVDLNPVAAYYSSSAKAISGDQQVGNAGAGGPHASLWTGTAASWVDLNPAGASQSSADGVSGGKQVGYAVIGDNRASLWSGTAASWVDLHALLPIGVYSSSRAASIYVSAGDIWVAGYALNVSTNQFNAILWHYTALTVANITPNSCPNTGSVSITDLAGTYFLPQATVKLTRSGQPDIVATGVAVVSPTKITCAFDLTGKQLGQWNVVVTNPDAQSDILTNSFTVTAESAIAGAKHLPVGTPVYIQDAVVTAPSLETGSVFVESSDRSSGIKLVTNQAFSPGDRVKFTGHIGRVDGEYRIDSIVFTEPATPGAILKTIFMTTSAVGNDRTETLTYEGINTTGLLVKLVGKITGVITAQNIVYLDDGGSYQDGYAPLLGLRCHVSSGVATTWKNKYYAITGISRVQKVALTIWTEVNGEWYAPGTVIYVPYIDALSAVKLYP